jgi:sec-independent protein translocase protein TatC
MSRQKVSNSKSKMALIEHLIELRRRLIYAVLGFFIAFIVCYQFAETIFGFLVQPLADLFEGQSGRRLIYTGLTEAFMTYIKVSIFSAAFVSFPIIAIQIWMFIAPGLYKHERSVFLPFLIATPVLFLLGGAFAYYFILSIAWSFFLDFESSGLSGGLPVQLEAKINEYLSLVMQLLFSFGVSFLLPVLLLLLGRAGFLQANVLAKRRKYAFLIILVVSAFLTPPDVLSMVSLALPIYALFELSVILMRWC